MSERFGVSILVSQPQLKSAEVQPLVWKSLLSPLLLGKNTCGNTISGGGSSRIVLPQGIAPSQYISPIHFAPLHTPTQTHSLSAPISWSRRCAREFRTPLFVRPATTTGAREVSGFIIYLGLTHQCYSSGNYISAVQFLCVTFEIVFLKFFLT